MARRSELFVASAIAAAGTLAGCGTEISTPCSSDYNLDLNPNSITSQANFPRDLAVGAMTNGEGTSIIVADPNHVLSDATREQGTPVNKVWTGYPLGKPLSFTDGSKTYTFIGTLAKDTSNKDVVKLSIRTTCPSSATPTTSPRRTVLVRVA